MLQNKSRGKNLLDKRWRTVYHSYIKVMTGNNCIHCPLNPLANVYA